MLAGFGVSGSRLRYVSRLGVALDGEPFAAIVSPPQEGRAQLTEFNFAHPLLRPVSNPDDELEDEDEFEGEDERRREIGSGLHSPPLSMRKSFRRRLRMKSLTSRGK